MKLIGPRTQKHFLTSALIREQRNSIPCGALALDRHFHTWLQWVFLLTAAVLAPAVAASAVEENPGGSHREKIWVYRLRPEVRGGSAYKLVYVVPVPVDVYWGFKTDFDNDFLVRNKYIAAHQFISRTGNTVVTQDRYSRGPDVIFRWQTTVFADDRRLEYILTNPEEAGQRFHYGYIQLASVREGTLVTQVAYFDFRGVSLWAAYPWAGGMKEFLIYTARWERDTVLQLKSRYSGADHSTPDH